MKAAKTVRSNFRYSVAILAAMLITFAYGCQFSEPAPKRTSTSLKTAIVKPVKTDNKFKVSDAACCKASFSRANILAGNSHVKIIPAAQ